MTIGPRIEGVGDVSYVTAARLRSVIARQRWSGAPSIPAMLVIGCGMALALSDER